MYSSIIYWVYHASSGDSKRKDWATCSLLPVLRAHTMCEHKCSEMYLGVNDSFFILGKKRIYEALYLILKSKKVLCRFPWSNSTSQIGGEGLETAKVTFWHLAPWMGVVWRKVSRHFSFSTEWAGSRDQVSDEKAWYFSQRLIWERISSYLYSNLHSKPTAQGHLIPTGSLEFSFSLLSYATTICYLVHFLNSSPPRSATNIKHSRALLFGIYLQTVVDAWVHVCENITGGGRRSQRRGLKGNQSQHVLRNVRRLSA